jgi:hypothetical protein
MFEFIRHWLTRRIISKSAISDEEWSQASSSGVAHNTHHAWVLAIVRHDDSDGGVDSLNRDALVSQVMVWLDERI